MSRKKFAFLLLLCCTSSLYMRAYSQDLEQLEKSYKKVVKQNEHSEAAKIAIEIADTYLSLPQGDRNYKKIIEYYNNAITQGKAASDKKLQAEAYLKLGSHYGKYSETINESIKDYNAGIAILEQIQDWGTYTKATSDLSKVYARQDNTIGRAITVLQRSQSTAKKYDINIDLEDYYKRFVVLYRKNGDDKNARIFFERLNGNTNRTASTTGTQSKNSEDAELTDLEFELAEAKMREEELSRRLQGLQTSSVENKDEINNLRIQLNATEKEKELYEQSIKEKQEKIAAQEKANKYLIGAVGLAVIVVIIAFIAYLGQQRANKRLAAKNAEILYQKQEIESQKYEIEKQSKKLVGEQEKSEKLLLNILPKATADELKENGFASPKSYDMVTVMFTDFKGFTNIAEQLTPVEIVRELDICFLKFDDIVERHNMEKIKTIGDAYMCAGGVPLKNTTNPTDAVKAGIEMQEFMLQRKQEKLSKGEIPFELRVGIHTGAVVAGVVGKRKFAYDIWGDAVNIAARMESSSDVGRVNISEVTYEYIKDSFYCNYRGKIQAKNKGEIDMYFVNGPI